MAGFLLGDKRTYVHSNQDPVCECGAVATLYCKTEMKILDASTWFYYCPSCAAEHERDTGDVCREIPPKMATWP